MSCFWNGVVVGFEPRVGEEQNSLQLNKTFAHAYFKPLLFFNTVLFFFFFNLALN